MPSVREVWGPHIEEWFSLHSQPPKVSHFTNATAAFSILGSRHLHATNMWDIRGQDEVEYTRDLVAAAIVRNRRRAGKRALEILDRFRDGELHELTSGQNAYIVCFTKDTRSTEMWSSPFADEGRGWKLDFYTGSRFLGNLLPAPTPSGIVARTIQYDVVEQNDWLDCAIKCLCKSLDIAVAREDFVTAETWFYQSLIEFVTSFKPQNYSTEGEIRLVYWNPRAEAITQRHNGSRVVHIPIALRSGPDDCWNADKDCLIEFDKVWQGPAADGPTDSQRALLRVVYSGDGLMFEPRSLR